MQRAALYKGGANKSSPAVERYGGGVMKAIAVMRRLGWLPAGQRVLQIIWASTCEKLEPAFKNTRWLAAENAVADCSVPGGFFKMFERKEDLRDWVRIALGCGYYGQAHFVKEFREVAGERRPSLFAEQNAICGYFIASS